MKTSLCVVLAASLLLGMADPAQPYDHPREKTEWMTSYHYNGDETALPRVLLVGDSICNQYNGFVREVLAGVAYVSFYATSKCCTDRTYLKALELILGEYPYAVIHFNNGLHSLDTPPEEWERSLRAAYKLMRETEPDAKIIWCSSTPLRDAEKTEKVLVLNAIGQKIATELNVPTDDLFSVMNPLDRAEHWSDDYHFKDAAKKMQARQVAASIRTMIAPHEDEKAEQDK